jgi:hypothetical protein
MISFRDQFDTRPLTEEDLRLHNEAKPVQGRARELPRAVISQELQDAADEAGDWAAERRSAHDKAAELMWRENLWQPPAAHGCYEPPADPPRLPPRLVVTLIALAAVVFAVCWVLALWK